MATAKVQTNGKSSFSVQKRRTSPSEKRRSQNREAQRKHREKLKNRLEDLERLAEQMSLKTGPLLPKSDVGHQSNTERVTIQEEEPHEIHLSEPQANTIHFIEGRGSRNHDIKEESIPSFMFGSSQELPLHIGESNFWIPNDIELPVQEFPLTNEAPILESLAPEFQHHFLQDPSATSYQQQESTDFPTINDTLSGARYGFDSEGYSESSMLSVSPPELELETQPLPHTASPISASTSSLQLYKDCGKTKPAGMTYTDKQNISQELIQYLHLEDTKENKCLVSTAVARGHNIRDIFLAGLQAMDSKTPTAKLPNPQNNTLTLVRTSTLQAYLTVAEAAGIRIPDLYLENTSSPFYKPNASPSDIQALIPFYASRMPPDLRPTAPQIMFPHRPWLDLLPFPTLRARALTLASMDPPLVDLLELKTDIFKRNGLFCWQNSAHKGGGHPWDRRSWEAEGWFLRKWWVLIGREEADVVCQTRWWREIRGEGKLELGWECKDI